MEAFEATVRRVGTSLGVLIPKEIANGIKVHEKSKVKVVMLPSGKSGQTIKVEIPINPKPFKTLLGLTKGARPFRREDEVREFNAA